MEIYDVVLIPLIIGLIEVFKIFGISKRTMPILSLVLGVLAGTIYIYPHDLKAGVLVGLMMGLSASGMYSGGKAIIVKDKVEKNEDQDW